MDEYIDFTVVQDRRSVELKLTNGAQGVRDVIDASRVDGLGGREWLDAHKRPVRKACLLNLLGSLRARPLVPGRREQAFVLQEHCRGAVYLLWPSEGTIAAFEIVRESTWQSGKRRRSRRRAGRKRLKVSNQW